MNKYLFWSLIVALSGLLFGFDTIVISGADQTLQSIWKSSNWFHGVVVMSSALWGTLFGALTGGIPTQKYGRKYTLFVIGLLYLFSAIGSALATGPYMFSIFRFIGGIGVGASTIAAPAYISEISPSAKRGWLVALYQLSIVMGILLGLLSNYGISQLENHSWRWMIGVEAAPAFLYSSLILLVPKSPRWLIMKGKIQEAKLILARMNIDQKKQDLNSSTTPLDSMVTNLDASIDQLIEQVRNETQKKESIFQSKYRVPLLLAFFIAFFNQFSGINAILYYAPRIFTAAGLGEDASLLNSVGIGLVNLFFTLLGMVLIDKMGRKKLLLQGSFGYIISLTLVACSFYFDWGGIAVALFLFAFIASHAIGQGAVIWVFIAEIFPTHLRPAGQAFGSSVHWVLAAIIPSLIPVLFSTVGPGWVFAGFAGMMVLQLVWVLKKVPETKGKSLEELKDSLNI